ncbi:MAG: arsenite methyltransferase [Chloroflexi bacterium]|nr:arsenite methyltransferase [Chloroflexota bacterium]
MDRDREIKRVVRKRYSQLAVSVSSCCPPASAAAPDSLERRQERAAEQYGQEALCHLPDAVIGASAGCGNPVALALLQPGQVVVDLGSGGGIDVFLSAEKVGPQGRAIGVDMTPEMIRLARENALQMGVTNVEFRLGEMEKLPLEKESADMVISNCVINLSPDKDAVFREAFRVLKPGGRLVISDIVLPEDIPHEIRQSWEAWTACVAGALREEVYLEKIQSAGFKDVSVVIRRAREYQGYQLSSITVTGGKL